MACFFKIWKRKDKKPQKTLQEVRNQEVNIEWLKWKYKNIQKAHSRCHVCLLCISNEMGVETIIIHKKDDEGKVAIALNCFNLYISENKSVVLLNYKNNHYKKWNRFKKVVEEGEISEVDFDSLIDVIKDIQNEGNAQLMKEKGRLKTLYFAVIYEMLLEGVFGTENNNMVLRDFVDYLEIHGLNPPSKSALSEQHNNLKGKTPYIYVNQSENKKSKELLNANIKAFIIDVNRRYENKSHKSILTK